MANGNWTLGLPEGDHGIPEVNLRSPEGNSAGGWRPPKRQGAEIFDCEITFGRGGGDGGGEFIYSIYEITK